MRNAQSAPDFTGYRDFVAAYNAARQAAITVFGPRWDLHPAAYVWARLPAAWACVRVAGKQVSLTSPGAHAPLSDDGIGWRWSKAPRDRKLPVARFWPSGELPIGPDYALAPSAAKPPKPRPVPSGEAQKRRRPSGVNLPSGYEQDPEWVLP
jgi:hypothetical protein